MSKEPCTAYKCWAKRKHKRSHRVMCSLLCRGNHANITWKWRAVCCDVNYAKWNNYLYVRNNCCENWVAVTVHHTVWKHSKTIWRHDQQTLPAYGDTAAPSYPTSRYQSSLTFLVPSWSLLAACRRLFIGISSWTVSGFPDNGSVSRGRCAPQWPIVRMYSRPE